MESRAQSACQESTRRRQDQLFAQIAEQGRILQQEGPQQVRHASPVHQTPTRLLRVQLWRAAPATRAIGGLTEAHAQRAWQERSRRQQDRPTARTAGQGRILQQLPQPTAPDAEQAHIRQQ